jgi:hypothetical protein
MASAGEHQFKQQINQKHKIAHTPGSNAKHTQKTQSHRHTEIQLYARLPFKKAAPSTLRVLSHQPFIITSGRNGLAHTQLQQPSRRKKPGTYQGGLCSFLRFLAGLLAAVCSELPVQAAPFLSSMDTRNITLAS